MDHFNVVKKFAFKVLNKGGIIILKKMF